MEKGRTHSRAGIAENFLSVALNWVQRRVAVEAVVLHLLRRCSAFASTRPDGTLQTMNSVRGTKTIHGYSPFNSFKCWSSLTWAKRANGALDPKKQYSSDLSHGQLQLNSRNVRLASWDTRRTARLPHDMLLQKNLAHKICTRFLRKVGLEIAHRLSHRPTEFMFWACSFFRICRYSPRNVQPWWN